MSTNSHTRRFFVSDLSSDEVHVHPSEVHHALHVVRLKDGDEVELFDGSGHVAVGVIGHISRKNVVVRITTRQPRQTAERPLIHLAFGSPKGKRLDWLVEKATELGVASLQRVIFERSSPNAKTESTAKSDKLLAHCISAAKQSGVNFLPELPAPVTLAELLSARDDSPGFLGDIAPAARGLSEAIGSKLPCESITLLIGPEGGLSENERNESIASGFIPVRIARTTLRTETASIALLGATVALLPLK